MSQRENDNFPATKLKHMESWDATDKKNSTELLWGNFYEIQQNSERQFDKLKNKINKQKEYFIKEIEIIEK